MQEYISKQQQILRPAAQIFPLISDFSLLTPAVADKVEDWQATADRCSFKAKGFTVALRIDEKVENKHIKITGDDGGAPIDFMLWIQLHQVSDYDTRIRLVLHAELNMMMRMMVGNKIQKGLDQAVEGLAAAFNSRP
ncbi:MAG: polyketide cyclase [Alistipes sp.]|nr:polyketide cyclase [Alistipes sp.]